MSSTYSTNLALELTGTGEQAGNWGATNNLNIGTLLEQAISGYVTQAVSTGTDTTLAMSQGASATARNMFIELTGTGGTSTNLIVPSNKKLYFIYNNTSAGQVTVKVSGQTGVSVPNGGKVALVSNGTDIVSAENYLAALTVGGNASVGGTLNVTGTSTLAAVGGTTITASTQFSGPGTGLTGTAASLSIGGNAATATNATNVTSTVPVNKGGTGSTSLTANNVLLGNGTSALQVVAPGASGNVLTSDGTTWTSSTIPAGGTVTSVATGNGLSGGTITTSGTLTIACPSAGSVGAYNMIGTTANAYTLNSTYSNPGGIGSGTWRAMSQGNTTMVASINYNCSGYYYWLFCRVS